ncbi:hypothetical protein BD410DRAFT_148177 [Rickenella mellea]|uniref:CCHC-type domain-containing protein n=1 Tax=Rickenella mellea TaxID=50990 RepID=A0A4Y7Q7V0_9AGAM|nr:hypothetical protein BD410DRAFT_148177 [Rickenella mellea]
MAQKPSSFGTFEAFEKDLKSSFEDPNKQRNAQIALSNTRQGLQETAEAFFQRFELNRRAAGYTTGYDQYLMELLERNLKNDIVRTIYSQDLPGDYAGWKKKAIQLDQQGRRLRSMFPTTQSRGQYVPRPQNQNITPAIPQKTGGAQTFPGLGQPMDIDRRREERSCYKCGVKGHIARFCRGGQTQQQTRAVEVMEQQPKTAEELQAEKKARAEDIRAKMEQMNAELKELDF